MHAFRPSLPLTIAAGVLVALTLNLAFWQFDRAEQKRALEQAAIAATTATAITLRAPRQIAPFQRAALVGGYLPENQILLDNRVHQRRAGYHVITPFALIDGGAILVNRGWLAGDGSRREPQIPAPAAGLVTVSGVFTTDSADAFRLSDAPETGRVRQRVDIAAQKTETGLALLSLVLLADATATSTLPAATLRTNYKSAQSTIYAWQWLTFCLLTVVFYVILGRRKVNAASRNQQQTTKKPQ